MKCVVKSVSSGTNHENLLDVLKWQLKRVAMQLKVAKIIHKVSPSNQISLLISNLARLLVLKVTLAG